jgi:hypothetical protein
MQTRYVSVVAQSQLACAGLDVLHWHYLKVDNNQRSKSHGKEITHGVGVQQMLIQSLAMQTGMVKALLGTRRATKALALLAIQILDSVFVVQQVQPTVACAHTVVKAV